MTRYAFDSEEIAPYVDILKSSRGEETFSTWRRDKTSEERNETSEEMFLVHVGNKK